MSFFGWKNDERKNIRRKSISYFSPCLYTSKLTKVMKIWMVSGKDFEYLSWILNKMLEKLKILIKNIQENLSIQE